MLDNYFRYLKTLAVSTSIFTGIKNTQGDIQAVIKKHKRHWYFL